MECLRTLQVIEGPRDIAGGPLPYFPTLHLAGDREAYGQASLHTEPCWTLYSLVLILSRSISSMRSPRSGETRRSLVGVGQWLWGNLERGKLWPTFCPSLTFELLLYEEM